MESSQETLLIACCLTVAILCANLGWSASLLVTATCAVITLLGSENVKYPFFNTFMPGSFAFAMRSKEDKEGDEFKEGDKTQNPRRKLAEKAEERVEKEKAEEEKEEEPHRGLKHFQQEVLQWEVVPKHYNVMHYRPPTKEERYRYCKTEAEFLALGNRHL